MTFYIILGFAAFLLSLLGTRATLETLRKRTPPADLAILRGEKRPPVPGGGGIVLVITLIICLLVADINYVIVLALFLLASVALLDDIIAIPAIIKLIVEIIAVAITLSMTPIPIIDDLPLWLDKLLVGTAWVALINIFRVMDGIDGLSASEMICIGLGLCLLVVIVGDFPDQLFTYGLPLAAAGFGFLWWNWYPAKIRLGDVGNIPIGFLTGYLLLLAAKAGYVHAALILPAYYVSDGTITVLRRLYLHKKLWTAQGEYYYQIIVRNGHRHDSVARYILGTNLMLVLLAILSALHPHLATFYLALAYMMVCMVLGFFAHGRLEHETA